MLEKTWIIRENQNGSSELMHYGVKGMKWGVRRTPEQLGHREAKKKLEGKPLKYSSPMRENVKDWLAYVGKYAVSYLVPGASIAFDAKTISDAIKYNDTKDYDKGAEKLSELKRKPQGAISSMTEDAKKVNKTNKKGYVKNCFNCVCALEMRQRGYDVEALPRSVGAFDTEYKNMFSGVELRHSGIVRKEKQSRKAWVMENYDHLCKDIEKNPEGSRGFLALTYEGSNSGHTISWTIKNGQVVFYDAQVGRQGADKVLSLSNQLYTWGRLDNLEPTEKITQVVGSKGRKNK